MNCEEISELLPAYVLGALDPDEIEAIEAHLRAGHEHDAELVDLRATVFAMDRYQEAIAPAPSARLSERIAGIVEPVPVATPGRQPRSWFNSPAFLRAAAAAAVLLLFGAGLFLGSTLIGGSESTFAYVIQDQDGAFMEVRGASDADTVTVIMDGLDRLTGKSYQVWAIRDSSWVSIGVCNTDEDGWWKGDFNFGLQEGEDVALTIEPRGGSERPTSDPVLSSLP